MVCSALGEALNNSEEEVIHLGCIVEELPVLAKGKDLEARKSIVEEGPAASCKLYVLTEDLDHLQELVVVVGKAFPKKYKIRDVGHSTCHQLLVVEGLPLVLVDGIHKKQALLQDLLLK